MKLLWKKKQNGSRRRALSKLFNGFTLIEMLLVLVIISAILYAGIGYINRRTEQMRIDRMSLQMQQILNASLAYYVDHGNWPTAIDTDLQGTYLPAVPKPLNNPWQKPYKIATSYVDLSGGKQSQPILFVYAQVTSTEGLASQQAYQIAGMLPMSYTSSTAGSGTNPPDSSAKCSTSATSCYVVSSVSIPGQNLNNATAVTFAGLYKHGGCVPEPQCPVDTKGKAMTPQIFVVPVSVSGVNDATATGNTPNVYPISSFTAYAISPKSGALTSPDLCPGTSSSYSTDCTQNNANSNLASAYWRVCLNVVTERGNVATTETGSKAWGQWVTLLAITRCSINNEPSGSSFSVFTN